MGIEWYQLVYVIRMVDYIDIDEIENTPLFNGSYIIAAFLIFLIIFTVVFTVILGYIGG